MPFIGAQPAVAEGTLTTEGVSGTINYTESNKTLYVEGDSRVDQDLTSDSTPTYDNLKLNDGGQIQEGGGTSAIEIDASGDVTKIGQDTPVAGEVLGWNDASSKVQWQPAFSGGDKFYGFRQDIFTGNLLLDSDSGITSAFTHDYNVFVEVSVNVAGIPSNIFTVDGRSVDQLSTLGFSFVRTATYRFYQEDSSNTGYVFSFATSRDPSGGTEYTTGVTKTGTPGSSGAYTEITVPQGAPDILYFFAKSGSDTVAGYGGGVSVIGSEEETFTPDVMLAGSQQVYRQHFFETSGLDYAISHATGHLIVTI